MERRVVTGKITDKNVGFVDESNMGENDSGQRLRVKSSRPTPVEARLTLVRELT